MVDLPDGNRLHPGLLNVTMEYAFKFGKCPVRKFRFYQRAKDKIDVLVELEPCDQEEALRTLREEFSKNTPKSLHFEFQVVETIPHDNSPKFRTFIKQINA